MSNASINMTIDLAAFRDSLTAAFKMYEATLAAMGKESPKAISSLTAELDILAEKAAKPVILDANGKPMQAAIATATSDMDKLETKAEQGQSKLGGWLTAHRQALSQFSLVYRGVMDVYNDVTRVFGSFIAEQAAAQQAAARVESAVRSTGGAAGYSAGQLKNMAGEMESLYAIDGDELLSKVTTPLLTFTSVSGEIFSQAQVHILNMSRALGIDLQGAAMQVGKALQDPIEGLTALRRSGVSFSDEQQEVIKALYNTGQAAEAQKMILAELGKEYGGQAEAFASTGAGKLEALKVSFDNLKESIGGGLVPVLTAFGAVANPILGWFGSMNSIMQATIVLLPLASAGWYTLMTSQIATATVSGTLSAALTAASAAVKGFFTSMGPVGWAIMGVTAVVTGITAAIYAKNRAEEESIRNQKQIIQKKQELIGEQRSEQTSVIELAKRYETLAGNTKRSKAESDEMSSIITIMKDKYPGLIGSTNDFNGALETMRTVADGAKDKLAELNREEQALAATQAKVAVMESRREALNAKSDVIGFVGEVGAAVRGIFGSTISTVQSQLGALGKAMKDDNAPAVKMWIDVIDKQSGVFTKNENERWQLLKLAANDYLRALQDLADVNSGKIKTSAAPSTVTNTSTEPGVAGREAETRLREAEAMMAELARLRKTETEQMTAEYEKRKAVILEFTADGSEAEKTALADLDAWKTQKEGEIMAREKSATEEKFRAEVSYLANLQEMGVSSYAQLKAKMEEYYAWAQANLPAEEAALVLKQLQESNLRSGAADKEKEDKERAHQRTLADIRAEWNGRNMSLEEQDLNAQLEALRRKYEDEKALMIEARMTEAQITEIYAKKKADIEQKHNDQIKENDERNVLSAASGMSKMLGQIGGAVNKESKKGFDTWKAMAIAQGYVDTFSAAIGAYKAMVGIPAVGPVLAAAAAAAAMVAGLANIANISKQTYEPPQAAEGGYLEGPGHDRGGVVIEAEGGEYITKKSRVSELGKGIFDFINNGPIATVRQLFAGMAMPAIEFNAAMAGNTDGGGAYSFAGGGSVSNNGIYSLLEQISTKLNMRPSVTVNVDPISGKAVILSELMDEGKMIRSGV